METVLLFFPQPCSIVLLRKPQSPSWRLKIPNLCFHFLESSSSSSSSCITRCHLWDSNAEPVRPPRFSSRFPGNKDDEDDDDDEEDGEKQEDLTSRREKRRWWPGESPDVEEEETGILEELVDSVWLFKALKSYGWMLPPFIGSLLLATGFKAFLLASAFPLGQAAVTLAFKLSGRTQKKRKQKARIKRKPFSSTVNNVEAEEREQETSNRTGKGKIGYQSWVADNNGSVKKDSEHASSFGGWDELDGMGSKRQPSQMRGRSRRTTPVEKGNLSGRVRKSGTPLLLRLLIAVFPFLDSWTKMFW